MAGMSWMPSYPKPHLAAIVASRKMRFWHAQMQLLPQSPSILPYNRLPKQTPTTNKSGNRPVLVISRLHVSCGPRVCLDFFECSWLPAVFRLLAADVPGGPRCRGGICFSFAAQLPD